MYPPVTIRILVLALCGWLPAGNALALSLGRAHGAALIGRPLAVTIPVTLDRDEAENLCPGADLFYGDSRISAASVRWEAGGPGQGVIRVESSAPVDEPTVTLYLRTGCKLASTRRYVLLAEPPPLDEPARPAAAVAAATVPVVPQGRPAASAVPPRVRAAGASVPAATGARREPAAPAATAATARSRPPAPRAQAPAARNAPRSRSKTDASAQPRLKLEPLDLSIERDPVLRLSTELGAPAVVDPQQRAGWSALWQALQKTPEASAQDVARLQGVQRELEAVRAATRQNAAELAALRGHVERAQSDRSTALWLVGLLGATLLALLAWIGWRWYRIRRLEQVGRWFEVHGNSVEAGLPTAPDPQPVPNPAPRTAAQVPARAAARATGAAAPDRAAWTPAEEFQASRGGTLRMVGVQELIDVHDKADFFLSIGETEQAIAALEAHVHDQVETGALPWLDLLELYHSLGRRADFERLRAEFRQRFTAQVPDFGHFDQPTESLEHYGRALERIVALWPSRRVLDAIEESIFRTPAMPGAEPFSLEAYRELVLLYHIARDLQPEDGAPAQAPGVAPAPGDSGVQPLHVLGRPPQPPLSDAERLMIPPASARLGVDIDLEDTEAPAADDRSLDFDISTFDPASGPSQRR